MRVTAISRFEEPAVPLVLPAGGATWRGVSRTRPMALFVAPCMRAHMPWTKPPSSPRNRNALKRLTPRMRAQPFPLGATLPRLWCSSAMMAETRLPWEGSSSPAAEADATIAACRRVFGYRSSVSTERDIKKGRLWSNVMLSNLFPSTHGLITTRVGRAPGCPHHAPAAPSWAGRRADGLRPGDALGHGHWALA
eukprot:scaffold44539_cov54-Phaeocystis_antarctica.AAC.3